MKKKLSIISCILSGFLLYGCPPPQDKITSEQGDCGVSSVQVDVGDKMMNVSWRNNCEKTIAGYFVYISEKSNDSHPFNQTPFDGDTNPEDGIENFEAKSLENGKKYYVSVRIINPDQTLSKSSNEIVAVCGPREKIELSIRYKSEQDGYSFDENRYVRADNSANDLYFFSKDGVDYIASPHNLDGFLRVNKLAKLNFIGDYQELRFSLAKFGKKSFQDKLNVVQNDWLQIQTTEKTNALIKVLGFDGTGNERKIKLFVAYSSLANEMIF